MASLMFHARQKSMDFRERTRIEFGPVEAYAGRHLRVAPIVGTSMQFSLQEAVATATSISRLRSLIDGSSLRFDVLRSLISSLTSVTWSFEVAEKLSVARLTAVSDGICVTLSVDCDSTAFIPFAVEGSLRGIAARIVVQLEYGE